MRIALANLRYPSSPAESVVDRPGGDCRAASARRADIICFPECYVPGYRGLGKCPPPPDAAFLERAWSDIAAAAGRANVAVVLGTERVTDAGLHASVLVINRDGTVAGFQDKVQIDPSEEGTYTPGRGPAGLSLGPAHLRRLHLPRRVALSGNGALGGASRRPRRLPPALSPARRGQLPAVHVRGPGQHVPREGRAVPGGGEHLLLRQRQLRRRRVADHVSRGRVPTARCRPTSPMARRGCSWPTSISSAATRLLALRCRT